jgi:hypothetical protein
LIREARGHLREPHTGRSVPLGTAEVATYELPLHVYDKILFVEKEGFGPIWEASQIAERFDMAIASGKGQPVEAVRELFARAEAGDYRLFVLHDADLEGYQIAHTLAKATKRMPSHSVEVIDLGLTVDDAIARNLPVERRTRDKALPRWMPERLSDSELEWFEGEETPRTSPNANQTWACKRVDLNALTAPELVAHVEAGLAAHGADSKIRPPQELVAAEASRIHRSAVGALTVQLLIELFGVDAIANTISDETASGAAADDWITEEYERDRTLSWREAIRRREDQSLTDQRDRIRARVAELARPVDEEYQP